MANRKVHAPQPARVPPVRRQAAPPPPRPSGTLSRPEGLDVAAPEELANAAFQEHQQEAFGLRRQQATGRIGPEGAARLGVLQAKMDGFWDARMARAQRRPNPLAILASGAGRGAVQRVVYPDMATMWAAVEPSRSEAQVLAIVNQNAALQTAYASATAHLAHMDFHYIAGKQPEAAATPTVPAGNVYRINYGLRTELRGTYNNVTRYIGAVLHEMMHVAAARQYATNAPPTGGVGHIANMNLPAPTTALDPRDRDFGLADNQIQAVNTGAAAQIQTMFQNWDRLSVETDLDRLNGALSVPQQTMIKDRIAYAKAMPGALAHYDTVLTDILFYLVSEGVQASRSYDYANRMLTEANARRLAAVGAVQDLPRAPLPIPAAPPRSFFRWLLEAAWDTLVAASA